MNIQSKIIGHENHISVMGRLETSDEQQQLIHLLRSSISAPTTGSAPEVSELHITFFETKTLPASILEALQAAYAAQHRPAIKIFVLHRQLSLYLSRLGIQNTLVFGKSLVEQANQRIQAVAVGGSAESLDKIFTIIASLPLVDISVFIVQHFPKDARNILDTLLQDKTPYKAITPQYRMKIEKNTIYVAPSDFHLKILGGDIVLTQEDLVNYSRPSIDVLFESASYEYKESLLAILLCGYGSDGSHSLSTLKANGSTVIVEDPLDCSARDMPQNALRTHHYDYKFPIQEMVSYLSRILGREHITFQEFEIRQFLALLHKHYGYDYQDYSLDSIQRRLQKAMLERGFTSFNTFSSQVLNDPELFEELFLEFSINVTHFFRNPEVFRTIRETLLPYLDTYAHIKIWCAGCSTGEEPYSLAILLDELGMLKKTRIYATDINPFVIAEAKNGLFSIETLEKNVQNYQDSGGTRDFRDYFEQQHQMLKIRQRLKDKILFFQHSLVSTGVLNEFQLILCRNVLIYFNPHLQERVLKLFSESLNRNGFLILGESETVVPSKEYPGFEEYNKQRKIYRKRKVSF